MTSKFALVIANTEYQDASFAKLTAPGKDAEEFAHILREPEFAAFDDVQVLINEGEGKTRRFIARFFAERKRDDLLLLYFSGHGVRNGQGQLFLAANDTEISILEATGIPAEFVTYAMNNSRSQRQLLILDCCNSGAFAHGSKSASAVGKSMGIATAFEGSGFGRVVLTATDATQYAWEGDRVIGNTQKSVFTHFLIEGLKGEADRDGDGRIHVDELYDYAYEQVVRRTPKQTPGKWSYKQQGDLVLRENLKPREVKAAPLPSDILELLSHPNSGVRRAGLQDLISLLDGKHLGLARAAQEKLREVAESDDSLTLRRSASDTLNARGFVMELPTPAPVEIPKEERKEEKKIEKPIAAPLRDIRSRGVDDVREKTLRVFPDWKNIASRFDISVITGIGALLLVISLATAVLPALKNLFASVPVSTTPFPTGLFSTSSPTEASPPQTPALDIGSTMISDKDGMTLLYVPAGEFMMGSNIGDSDERPAHKVYLDAFWIDQTEVTNEMFKKCVQEGGCDEPSMTTYYHDSNYANHPVVSILWEDAKAYCSWANRRLPTEAEWEKAARGEDGRIYPWGNDSPNINLLNYGGVGSTTEVGKYPTGISPYQAVDMAGNAGEWVADWYDGSYYNILVENARNPGGPASGEYRGVRGGSWSFKVDNIRSADRDWRTPSNAEFSIGFRCAISATP